MADEKYTRVMVVGGGIAGVTTAIEVAEMGYEVILVEKSPSLGGRVARLAKYFPKLCPPWCGLEINYRRIKDSKNIRVFTMAEVEKIEGEPRNFDVTVKLNPRFIKPETADFKKAVDACEVLVDNEFNLGMDKTKAIHYYHDMAYPNLPLVEAEAINDPGVKEAIEKSGLTAFDLEQKPEELTFKVGAIVWATGWNPFDATEVGYLGLGTHPDIIQNVEMERLCAVSGPTDGKVLRPSDSEPAKKVAFVQCAGSRDANHLAYCSGVCCMASLKQARLLREKDPESEAHVFYIDLRSDRYYDFMQAVEADEQIHLTKGKAGKVQHNPETNKVEVWVENIATGKVEKQEFDLVVLATGLVPATKDSKIPYDAIEYNEYGFVVSDPEKTGIFPVGCLRKPIDVSATIQEATGVSIKAIQTILGGD